MAAPLLAVLYAYRVRNEKVQAAGQTEVAQVTDNRA
jgi:hypothetical protein